jgi:hypothetical protein
MESSLSVSHPLLAYRGKDAPGSKRIVGEDAVHPSWNKRRMSSGWLTVKTGRRQPRGGALNQVINIFRRVQDCVNEVNPAPGTGRL